jgi:hypothetical protein
MTILKIIGNLLGVSGSGWLLYMGVGGWKADALWILMGSYWLVQTLRACVKLYYEVKEKEIELAEKRRRYDKDIFT